MRKKFSNKEILEYAHSLTKIFLDSEKNDINLPIKINFYLQKNIKTILNAAQDIETMRLDIGRKYGTYNSDSNAYIVDDDKRLTAENELQDLMSIDQILDIYVVSLDELQQISSLTVLQMNAMMFMIEEYAAIEL